ncbi:MAG: UvrD-helicase domain-containing protein [Alphaproteobacteria bacterium]|nr:UvrD-helicase domain-containing protein [Alphaproteobacteria bacterium]MCL2889988.1 UvrD-helicase domain-containing protein [Alphaproteobacteria bacterium]
MSHKRKLSLEQTLAADPTQNIWVQANAGTGKTSVLVLRLLRILFRSDDKNGILCLTYTNAGASEMRNRILAALREWAFADDDNLRDLLVGVAHERAPSDADLARTRAIFYEYIDNPQMLKIRTIHGFCEEILRRFPIEAGIGPAWKLVFGAEQTRLQKDVFQDLMNEQAGSGLSSAFDRIISQVSEYSLDDLLNILTGQYKQFFKTENNFNIRQQFIDTTKQLLKTNNLTGADFCSSAAIQNRKLILDSIATEPKPAGYLLKISEQIKKNLCNNGQWNSKCDFNEYKAAFLTATGTKNVNVSKKDYLVAEQDLVYTLNQENINREIFENTIALYDLTAVFAQKYRKTKLDRGSLDFDDLILYTNKLFSDPAQMGWILSQLDTNLHHILVDEAQDTSPEQWEIMNALTMDFTTDGESENPRSLFVVGDTKQSIYSFQGADPTAFAKSKDAIDAQIRHDARRIVNVPLEQSFRSTSAVLSTVDHFFSDVSIGSLTKFKNNIHKCFRNDDFGLVELHPLTKPAEDVDSGTARKQFICDLAGKIENLLTEPTLKPSDIMILVQRRHPFAAPLISELQKRGIPVAGSDRIKLPEFPAIRDLLNLVRFCIDQSDDYALACILRSPLFRSSEHELYALCHNRNKELLLSRINELNPELYTKFQQILEWKNLAPYSFFMKILNTDDRRQKMIAALGGQIIDPLEEFLTICLSYERTQPGELIDFLEWFIKGDSEITRDIDASAGVRIVTTHGAKGLEAPCVFLIDTIRNPRNANTVRIAEPIPTGDTFLWRGRADKSENFTMVADAKYQTQLEEYYRLLYVAMTRARDRLYIYGFNNTLEPPADSWHTRLAAVLATHPYAAVDENGIIRITK